MAAITPPVPPPSPDLAGLPVDWDDAVDDLAAGEALDLLVGAALDDLAAALDDDAEASP